MVDRISDNYGIKKPRIKKRKARDIDEAELELDEVAPKDGMPVDLKVCMKDNEIIIEIRSPYREYMLLDIMDEANKLQLDVHSVQSSTLDGIFALTLKSKVCAEDQSNCHLSAYLLSFRYALRNP